MIARKTHDCEVVATALRLYLDKQQEEERRRAVRRRRNRTALAAGVIAAAIAVAVGLIISAVATVNQGAAGWAALVMASVVSFGFLNGLYFAVKELVEWRSRPRDGG